MQLAARMRALRARSAKVRARSLWVCAALLVGCAGAPESSAPGPAAVGSAEQASQSTVREARGRAFGTTWSVRWVESVPAPDPARVVAAVERALAEVDAGMSTWRDDSELSRARAAASAVPVSEDTAAVVRVALALAQATGGAFDPTVQPLMELWGFHGTARTSWPAPAEIERARQQVGWERVRLGRDEAGRPTLDVGGTALDLSAIAKGHGVDRVLHAIAALGVHSAFVEVGGEVRAVGVSPTGRGWRVGVNLPDPAAAPDELAFIVEFTNAAVATSGNYRNVVKLEGREVGHTMDPRTGEPATTSVRSATVLAPDCRLADGIATALMVLPFDEGQRLVGALPDVEAAWILASEDGFELRLSSGLPLDAALGRSVSIVHDRVGAPTGP